MATTAADRCAANIQRLRSAATGWCARVGREFDKRVAQGTGITDAQRHRSSLRCRLFAHVYAAQGLTCKFPSEDFVCDELLALEAIPLPVRSTHPSRAALGRWGYVQIRCIEAEKAELRYVVPAVQHRCRHILVAWPDVLINLLVTYSRDKFWDVQ
jgi:hypothetical protein